MKLPDIKSLVKYPGPVKFVRCEDRKLWYAAHYFDGDPSATQYVEEFRFPVDVVDTDGATFLAEDRPIFFMRWMRQHLDYLRGAEANPSADAPSGNPVPSGPYPPGSR